MARSLEDRVWAPAAGASEAMSSSASTNLSIGRGCESQGEGDDAEGGAKERRDPIPFGTVSAKMAGLGHTYYNLTGTYEKPIKIRSPYSNIRCLSCHGGAANFVAKHEKEQVDRLLTAKDSCLDCHGPAHKTGDEGAATPKQASR